MPFTLATTSEPVQKIFAITHLERAIATHATVRAALTDARPPPHPEGSHSPYVYGLSTRVRMAQPRATVKEES